MAIPVVGFNHRGQIQIVKIDVSDPVPCPTLNAGNYYAIPGILAHGIGRELPGNATRNIYNAFMFMAE
jgi:hypothetical protein